MVGRISVVYSTFITEASFGVNSSADCDAVKLVVIQEMSLQPQGVLSISDLLGMAGSLLSVDGSI